MIPFSHAIVDEDGEVVRKFRWSAKEAKWHKEQGKNVVALPKEKIVKVDLMELVGECLF